MQARIGILVSVLAAAIAVVAALLWLETGPAPAGDATAVRQVGSIGDRWVDYRPDAFAAALSSHKTVLVAVHADWCTDCAVQAPILARLMKDPAFENAVGYVVDFDRERRFLVDHEVRTQSTLIVFKDGVEVARSVADTNAARIRALFAQGL